MLRPSFFAVALVMLGCGTDPEIERAPLDGVYTIVASRADGSVETSGWIRITMTKDSAISGMWQLSGIDGDGKLTGTMDGDTARLNLHPGWADHSFLLHGALNGDRMQGRWEFIGFAGPMKSGSFIGTR